MQILVLFYSSLTLFGAFTNAGDDWQECQIRTLPDVHHDLTILTISAQIHSNFGKIVFHLSDVDAVSKLGKFVPPENKKLATSLLNTLLQVKFEASSHWYTVLGVSFNGSVDLEVTLSYSLILLQSLNIEYFIYVGDYRTQMDLQIGQLEVLPSQRMSSTEVNRLGSFIQRAVDKNLKVRVEQFDKQSEESRWFRIGGVSSIGPAFNLVQFASVYRCDPMTKLGTQLYSFRFADHHSCFNVLIPERLHTLVIMKKHNPSVEFDKLPEFLANKLEIAKDLPAVSLEAIGNTPSKYYSNTKVVPQNGSRPESNKWFFLLDIIGLKEISAADGEIGIELYFVTRQQPRLPGYYYEVEITNTKGGKIRTIHNATIYWDLKYVQFKLQNNLSSDEATKLQDCFESAVVTLVETVLHKTKTLAFIDALGLGFTNTTGYFHFTELRK